MYVANLALLANHLAIRDYSLHEVLDFTLRRVLTPINCTSIIFFQSDNFDRITISEMVGVASKVSKTIDRSYSLDQHCPAAAAIRTGSIIWTDDSEVSIERFPDVEFLSSLRHGKTLIAVPILDKLTPNSAIIFFLEGSIKPNRDIELFLSLINSILALYFAKTSHASASRINSETKMKKLNTDQVSKKLSERQLVIVKLVSEGRTNTNISQILGYSESTVRQEVMKIFKLYNFHHRREMRTLLSPMPKIMNRSPSESLR